MRLLQLALVALAFSLVVSAPAALAAPDGYPIESLQIVGGKGPDGKSKLLSLDSNGNITADRVCSSTAQSVVSVGVTAATVPAASLQGRRSVVVCVSAENVGSPKVKCLVGGTAPVMGAANPGQVLTVDSCFPFGIASTDVLKCISDTAGTAVTTFECV